ncbi:MAG: hypothetical protein IPK00_20430 [Deltaproteobacteria bacterium]|nr:hypothetical protein [Deltaproteobacteria bacterium]
MKHPIVIEETVNGHTAHSPDLPGVAAAGTSLEETQRTVRQAVAAGDSRRLVKE